MSKCLFGSYLGCIVIAEDETYIVVVANGSVRVAALEIPFARNHLLMLCNLSTQQKYKRFQSGIGENEVRLSLVSISAKYMQCCCLNDCHCLRVTIAQLMKLSSRESVDRTAQQQCARRWQSAIVGQQLQQILLLCRR